MKNDTITVLSFNLKRDFGPALVRSHQWSARRELAVRTIGGSGASVIGVQELLPSMREDMRRLLRDDYTIVGTGRFCGAKPNNDEHSDILVKNADAEVVMVKTFWLSKHPERQSRAYYAMFPRICTVAELRLRKSGKMLRVFNTHLDHICTFARRLGVEVILRYMREFNAERPMPTVLMGDLNCKPKSRPVRLLHEHVQTYPELHLTDVYSKMENEQIYNTFHNFKGKVKAGARPIDYIFVSDGLEIEKTRILTESFDGNYPSDHYPLLAELRFSPDPVAVPVLSRQVPNTLPVRRAAGI